MGCMGGVLGGVQGERAVTEGSITATFVVRTVLFGMGLGICHSDGFLTAMRGPHGVQGARIGFSKLRATWGYACFCGTVT